MSERALAAARAYVSSGLSIVPIRPDGSKACAVRWQNYQQSRPTDAELQRWFAGDAEGMALICGAVSGNLEILDFDEPAALRPWRDTVEGELGEGYTRRLPASRTPSGGTHYFWRCSEIAGNQKLARDTDQEGKPYTMIETRGEGGYAVIPPTPARYHPDNAPYKFLHGDLFEIPEISPQERATMLDVALALNRYTPPARLSSFESTSEDGRPRRTGRRPGDIFNTQKTWWDVLEPHGWRCLGMRGDTCFWQRPGKKGLGCSATASPSHYNCLYVFSTNADPFEAERSYTLFGAWALLEWGGDFSRARDAFARELGLPPLT